MIEREETRLEKYEPIIETMLVCLSCNGHIPRLFLSYVVPMLKLFDVFCSLVFDPVGKSPSTLIIRDWPLPRFQSHFR